MPGTYSEEIAAAAARWSSRTAWNTARQARAAKQLGLHPRDADMPDNDQLEDEVRTYLALFCAESQPRELAALRSVATVWMERLAAFRPHLTGAVWRGTATRHSDESTWSSTVTIREAAELALIDGRIDYEVSTLNGPRGSRSTC
jgi:hypothetical protein